ncbi:MAG: response regulator [Rhodothermales bacterium]|nr:response regulator [Rhodothermales bacterium]
MKLHREPGELIGFVRELVRGLVPMAERRQISLTFESEVEHLPALFDPDAIEKIFVNLISNALKFSSEESQVSVGARLAGSSELPSVVISVVDTGPGIPEEQVHRIFERFQQGDTSSRRQHEGSGIGLTLARDLTELHDGTLTVDSVVGEGSRFEVTLPVDTPDDAQVSERAAAETVLLEDVAAPRDRLPSKPDEETLDRPTILVVEDNADVRDYLRTHLGRDNYVIEAEDGSLGLEAAQEHEPDLILSDVMMPNMDGYEMCRLIKANEKLRHIPIVMLTAKASERDTIEGLQSGADDYLEKPFSVAELTTRVSNLISTRRELHEAFSREIFVRPADIEITPEEEVFLDRLLDAINTHLGDANLTIDWLADDVGLSRRQLERRVEAVTGQSPAALVRRFRLERASQLLRARAGTVSEISYAVGFRSPAHFSKAFRQAFGEPPSEHVRLRSESEEA